MSNAIPKRDAALDATRTFAIWLMVACHVARLITKNGYIFSEEGDLSKEKFVYLRRLFKASDIDGNKTLSLEEFGSIFAERLTLSSETINSLFQEMDINNNGRLVYRELYQGVTRVMVRPWWMEFSLEIEPLCQALFMSMVGVSLVYSMRVFRAKEKPGWQKKQLRRAAELYGIGFVFFLFQYGIQFPWMFIGHGILLSISSAIALCTPIVYKEWGMKAAFGLLVLLVGSHWIMDYNQIQVAYINAGNGPFMPHVILSAFGLVCAYILLDCGKRIKLLFLALMMACAVGSFYRITTLIEASSALDTFVAIFDYPHGRKDFGATYRMAGNGPGQIWAVLTGGDLKDSLKEYYNYRPVAIPMLMALVTGVYCLFKLLGPLTEKLQPLWLVGRHSLGVYILHLIIIALTTVVLGSLRPFESGMSIQLYFFFVLVVCYGYALWKSKKGSLFSKTQSS